MSDPATRDTTETIEADHAGWKVWRSNAGSGAWYGTRHDLNLSEAAMERGCARTVAADTPQELRQLLDEQGRLDAEVITEPGSLP